MKKGSSMPLFALFLIALIATVYTAYSVQREMISYEYSTLRSSLRFRNYELERQELINETQITFDALKIFQTLNNTLEIPNLVDWDYPVIIQYLLSYNYNQNYEADYEELKNIEIYYPIKEYKDKTDGITAEQLEDCVCGEINQQACNTINNTNFEWGAEVCSGIPLTLKVKINSLTNLTREFPHYLFGGLCEIICV